MQVAEKKRMKNFQHKKSNHKLHHGFFYVIKKMGVIISIISKDFHFDGGVDEEGHVHGGGSSEGSVDVFFHFFGD